MRLGTLSAVDLCPSLQQLQGVVDYNDPCQFPGGVIPVAGDTLGTGGETASGNPLDATDLAPIPTCPLGVAVSGTCICPPGYSLDPNSLQCTKGGLSTTMLMALAIGVGLFVFGGGFKR